MTKEQIKQALISILIGALTIFLLNLLEGLFGLAKTWLTDGAGGAVATGRYLLKTWHT